MSNCHSSHIVYQNFQFNRISFWLQFVRTNAISEQLAKMMKWESLYVLLYKMVWYFFACFFFPISRCQFTIFSISTPFFAVWLYIFYTTIFCCVHFVSRLLEKQCTWDKCFENIIDWYTLTPQHHQMFCTMYIPTCTSVRVPRKKPEHHALAYKS